MLHRELSNDSFLPRIGRSVFRYSESIERKNTITPSHDHTITHPQDHTGDARTIANMARNKEAKEAQQSTITPQVNESTSQRSLTMKHSTTQSRNAG